MARAAIILAAGQGTRMKSALPKVMHAVAGLPIVGHVIRAARDAGVRKIVVVTAPGADALTAFAHAHGAETAVQDKQLGTGHAAASARGLLGDFHGTVVVTYGDMPLLTAATFDAAFAAQMRTGMSLVAFRPEDPAAYGRVLLDKDGLLDRIVEFKDANADIRAVGLCNAGIVTADVQNFFKWAAELRNENAQNEYYLTDVPTIARTQGVKTSVVVADAAQMMGVNSRSELAAAESAMQARLRAHALDAGAGMTAPETVFLCHDTVIEPDAQIGPFVVFGPGVTIKSGAEIKAFSHVEGAVVSKGALVGPYARLRPGAVIEEDVHIGNFVEVKNSRIEKGAKANHLTYLGDARVGAGANIGAGTITCNYDGFDKHHTDIGKGAFIGSNSALVAPVSIGDGTYVGAGSVITKETAPDSLAVTRADQKEIPGWAAKFRTRKKAERAAKGK
ncbi:MAG TPA: bifunctional UDP-N-acetylglucosamine diphosphorylase/glucosamine-1-phosphate N-acetyltransferase GlmU [Rhizomicrobium sp.]|nr:bifunctional UDP-N-acetylglucosamine diphosphorylase/glucosamine-1-phosphate N-acetyltransferase GlmU [Rhizomicrobium sp.]